MAVAQIVLVQWKQSHCWSYNVSGLSERAVLELSSLRQHPAQVTVGSHGTVLRGYIWQDNQASVESSKPWLLGRWRIAFIQEEKNKLCFIFCVCALMLLSVFSRLKLLRKILGVFKLSNNGLCRRKKSLPLSR